MRRRDLWLLWAAALAVRVAAAAAGHRLVGYSGDGLYDDGVFLQMAQSFLGRDPSILSNHPPLFSLFLAPFLAVGGAGGYTLARLAVLSLGAAVAPLTVLLAESLEVGSLAALSAGVLAATSPLLVYFSTRFMSEVPFTALAIFFFLVWLKAWREGSLGRSALAGALGGAASLTRAVFLPFGGALALVALWRRREQPRWLSMIVVCGLCWAATIAPWTARNWVRFHRFIPISVQGGWNFYEGMVLTKEEAARRPYEMAQEARAHGATSPLQADEYFAREARREIAEHPAAFAKLTARKALKFWRVLPYYPSSLPARAAIGGFTLLAFALALLGLTRVRLSAGWEFTLTWVAMTTVLHALFASDLRYRLPLEPVIFSASGAGVAAVLRRWRS